LAIGLVFTASIARRLSGAIARNRWAKTRERKIPVLRIAYREFTMSDDSFTDFRQADGRFAKGNPGGPGRPRARDRIAALDQIVADAGPDLIEAALKVAKSGNVKAIEMLLDRVWPARRGRPVEIEAPEIRAVADVVPASAAVTSAVLNGDVTPREGAAVARVIEAHGRMIELVDLERRMTELEKEGASLSGEQG
jgi:hypothetical protein